MERQRGTEMMPCECKIFLAKQCAISRKPNTLINILSGEKKFLFRCFIFSLECLWFAVNEQSFLVIIQNEGATERVLCVWYSLEQQQQQQQEQNPAKPQWNPSLRLTNEIFMNLIFLFSIYYASKMYLFLHVGRYFLSSSFYCPIFQFHFLSRSLTHSVICPLACNGYKSYQFKTAGVCNLKTMKQHKNTQHSNKIDASHGERKKKSESKKWKDKKRSSRRKCELCGWELGNIELNNKQSNWKIQSIRKWNLLIN